MTFHAEPPVEPGREEARDWLVNELQKAEYGERRTLLQQILDAIGEWLESLRFPDAGMPGPQLAIVLAVVVVIVLAVAWFVAGPVRRERRGGQSEAVVEKDDNRTARQMRAAADAAAGAGDWSTAVVERFRAVVRSSEERAIIDPRPGRTAQEAATDIGAQLPALAARLQLGAGLFDQVEYGRVGASASDDDALRQLDQAVTAARVERKAPSSDGGGSPSAQAPGSTPVDGNAPADADGSTTAGGGPAPAEGIGAGAGVGTQQRAGAPAGEGETR